jgi:O-antigen biosynthesis protein
MNSPLVTVVISTRNRSLSVAETIQTVLRNDYPRIELMVIDQSKDDKTEGSVQRFFSDPRFRYEKTSTVGLSTGHNLGIANAHSELIAIIDDDCEAPAQWLGNLVKAFAAHPGIGLVFGNVLPGPHDRFLGFIPAYVRNKPLLILGLQEKHRIEGMGACMGLKRTVWHELSGFDEMLGPGAPFKAAGDIDYCVRTLLAGYSVYETPSVEVIHRGFRTWKQGREIIHAYLYGLGAMHAKHFKCGHWALLHYFFHLTGRWAFKQPAIDFGHHPPRLLRLGAFVRGFSAGMRNSVNNTTLHYFEGFADNR